jgi:uncharacterized iron-regulated membrane protein
MRYSFSSLLTRSVWLKVHTYLALSLGLVFSIIGLTGSLCVYSEELDTLFNPDLYIESSQLPLQTPDQIIAAVRAAQPNRHGVWTLEMPRTPHSPITAWFENPAESTGAFYAPLILAVHPYTGKVLSSRFWGQTLTSTITDLHTQLLLDGFGRQVMAVFAWLLCLSVCSGLYLWWPKKSQLLAAFSVRHDQGLTRFIFDLHRLLGFFSAPLLLVLAFTGFHLTYPPLLEYLTSAEGMGHGDEGPTVRSSAIPNDRPIKLQEAVLIARAPFPSSEVRRISTPRGETGTYRINLRQRDEINQHHPMTTVWIDRWSGQIRDVQNPQKFSSGQRFTTWMWPLHTGEAYGSTGKFLWFLGGLSPAILYVSGLWHWLYRRGAVQDRPIDLTAIRQHLFKNLQNGYRLSQKLVTYLQPRARKAFNYLFKINK